MLFLKIALRNLFRQRRRTILTGLTMAVGFILLSFSLGTAEGSYSSVIKLFTEAHTGHIQIHTAGYRDRPSLYKTIEAFDFHRLSDLPFVKSWTPRVYSSALAYGGNKALGVQIMGVDPILEARTTTFEKRISQGDLSSDGVVITYALGKALKLDIGDQIVLISQGADGSIANDLFPISGVIGTKKETEKTLACYLSLPRAQEFLALGGRVHEIAIMTDSHILAPSYANEIRHALGSPSLDIQPWQVVEKSFYEAMLADIKGMWISLGIIIFIIAIGVLNSVLMTLLERTREYGLLKALGTGPAELTRLIFLEVFLLSFFSCTVGGGISFMINWYFTKVGVALPEPIEYGGISFTTYYSVLSLDTYWIPALIIMASSFIVSLFPTIGVIRKPPVEAFNPIT